MRRFVVLAVSLFALFAVAPAVGVAAAASVINVAGPYQPGTPERGALVTELEGVAPAGSSIAYTAYDGQDELVAIVEAGGADVVITSDTSTLFALSGHLESLKKLKPLAQRAQFMTRLRTQYGDYLIDAVRKGKKVLAGPIRTDIKSLVWYQPSEFAAGGYAVPKTFKQLVALSNAIVADGETPWCTYIGSGTVTGWVGTDWVEDLVLGHKTGRFYDRWVSHDVLFDSRGVKQAFKRFKKMIDTPGYVYDRANMATAPWQDNAAPLEAGDCLMHKQGSFFGNFFSAPEDVDTFFFPGTKGRKAAMGTTTLVGMTNLRPVVKQLMRAILHPNFGTEALSQIDTWIMPNTKFDRAKYANDRTKKWANRIRVAVEGTAYRMDASDQMPEPVGFSAFFTGIVDLVDGTKTIKQIVTTIDAAWP